MIQRPLGVVPPVWGDGPYIDIGMLQADEHRNWDDFIYNGAIFGAGPYLYGSFSTSTLGTAAQYSSRSWWRDFGPGGLWDVRMIHTVGFDVGVYSVQVDGREIGSLDGWVPGNDVNNLEADIGRRVRIGPGRHKITIVMRSCNAGATGLKFYPAIQGLIFRRVGRWVPPHGGVPHLPKTAVGHQVISIVPLFAVGNTNWDILEVDARSPYNCHVHSTGAQNAARWWDVDLAAGDWDIEVKCLTRSSGGIISVQVDGVTRATIDTYSASTTFAVTKTVRISVPTSGRHELRFLMATKNGSSSQYDGYISAIQLHRVGPGRGLPLRTVTFPAFWSHADVNWHTKIVDGNYAWGGDYESSGALGDSKSWQLAARAGVHSIEVMHATGPNRGLYSVRWNGREVAFFDGYSPGLVRNVRTTLAGIQLPAGLGALSLVMASKNGSSSAYYGTVTMLSLRRTST